MPRRSCREINKNDVTVHHQRPQLGAVLADFKGDTQMTRLAHVESDSFLKHGILMIALGTAVCGLGSVMAKPIHQGLGYLIAATGIGTYLLIASLSARRWRKPEFSRRLAITYIAAGSAMVCYAIFIPIQSNSRDIPVVSLLAGLLGLFWGYRYLTIAFTFLPTSPQAMGLCALAAANSSCGAILGTQAELSKLTTVTVSGCYAILLGVQIYITAAMFLREPTHEKVLDQP